LKYVDWLKEKFLCSLSLSQTHCFQFLMENCFCLKEWQVVIQI
jgi:hypothetical protein